jgi:hypothetical protein
VIHLTNLGTDAEGITAADLSRRILGAILENSVKVAVNDIGKGVADAATGAAKSAIENAEKAATKGISDLFKKNK